MSGNEASEPDFVSLDLYASTTFRVQLSDGVKYRHGRLDVKAHLDPTTGEVRLFADPAEVADYLQQHPQT